MAFGERKHAIKYVFYTKYYVSYGSQNDGNLSDNLKILPVISDFNSK